jgi:hypothetical protein
MSFPGERTMRIRLFCVVLSLCFTAAAATTQHEVFNNHVPFKSGDVTVTKGLDADKATLSNPSAAREFINRMRAEQLGDTYQAQEGKAAACPKGSEKEAAKTKRQKEDPASLPSADGCNPDTYVLIHLTRWSDSSTASKPKVEAEHWYLYRDNETGKWSQEDFTTAKRLLGVTRVYVLYVHFNADKVGTYIPDYDLTITKKTPANVTHLYALLQAYAGGANVTNVSTKGPEPNPDAVWGGGILNVQYRPSDILIKSSFKVKIDDPDQKLADDITFDNEGPYYWDVGFAIPVRKISELKLDTTSGTATPAKVNSENVFAVLDGYLRPVDVKGSAFNAIPHPIAGVAFAKQPLSKILIGGAWGPKASELYMGAMFVKQPGLSANSSCSNPSGTSLTGKSHYCAQFTIGINLSVSAIASKLGAPK